MKDKFIKHGILSFLTILVLAFLIYVTPTKSQTPKGITVIVLGGKTYENVTDLVITQANDRLYQTYVPRCSFVWNGRQITVHGHFTAEQ